MSVTKEIKRITTQTLQTFKRKGVKISALTAYDFITASIIDKAGIDVILVGDSLGNVFQGNETTLPVTMDEMIYHTKAVTKGVERAMVVVDLPFMSYQTSINDAFRNSGRIMKETHAGAVKLEGGERIAESVMKITEAGIPVMGHVGLTPQSIHQFGSYKARGKNDDEAKRIVNDAVALEQAGAFAIVLEKIPLHLAEVITNKISIPTIGIGAGMHCDGQILVIADMIGLNTDFHPRFVRQYGNVAEIMTTGVKKYIEDVKDSKFPTEEESY